MASAKSDGRPRRADPRLRSRRRVALPTTNRALVTGIAFASQKQHVSFYLLRSEVRAAFDQRLQGYDMGKGLIVRRPEAIGFDLARDPLHATVATPGTIG